MALLDLSNLSAASRQLVQDARYRARLTATLIQADPSSSEAATAHDAIDAAVVEILAVAGLPRGPINGPVVDHFGRSWYGRKAADCMLLIDVGTLALLPDEDRSDSMLRTWIHESLHARRPFSPGFRREWQETRGYEEGLAEGLTRLIVVESLGLRPVAASYDFYVAAYRALAVVLGVDVEQLWRVLWAYPGGDVATMLVYVAERILVGGGRAPLSREERARFVGLAMRHFTTDRVTDRPNEEVLVVAWRSVIG